MKKLYPKPIKDIKQWKLRQAECTVVCCLSRPLGTLVMPYCSGAVATVSSGPVSYKMPVPSHSRFTSSVTGSSYRTTTSLSSSLDRPYYSSHTRTIPRSYTSEYKSKYTSPSRWVPEFCCLYCRFKKCSLLSRSDRYWSVQKRLLSHRLLMSLLCACVCSHVCSA
jgi:hypothetical protein